MRHLLLTLLAGTVAAEIRWTTGPLAFGYGPRREAWLQFEAGAPAGEALGFGSTALSSLVPGSTAWVGADSVRTTGGVQLLLAGGEPAVLAPGTLIGPEGGAWSEGEVYGLVTYDQAEGQESPTLDGPLAEREDGYLGVRLRRGGATHYGWVHVRRRPVPEVLEWALETTPGRAVAAGAAPPHGPVPVALLPLQPATPGHVRLSWRSEPGRGYRVQMAGSLAGGWSTLPLVLPATGPVTEVDLPLAGEGGLFRIIEAAP